MEYEVTAPDGTALVLDGPSNATPEQIRSAAERAWAAGEQPRTGHGVNLGAGLVEGIPQMVGGIRDLSRMVPLGPQWMDAMTPLAPMVRALAGDEDFEGSYAQDYGDAALDVTGLDDVQPGTDAEKWTRAAGRGVSQAIPALAVPGLHALKAKSLGGLVTRGGLEVASGVAGEVAATEASQHTDNPWLIGAAGMAGGLTPSAVSIPVAGVSKGVLSKMAPDSSAAQEIADLVVKQDLLAQAGKGGTKRLAKLADHLESPDAAGLTTAQAAEHAPRGAQLPGLTGREEFIAKRVPDLHADIAEQRAGFLAQTADELDEVIPQGSPGEWVQTAAMQTDSALSESVEQGFKNARGTAYDLPASPGKAVNASLGKGQRMIDDGWGDWVSRRVMSKAKMLDPGGSTVGELEDLREMVNAELRRELARPDGRGRAIAYLEGVKGAIDETFQEIADQGASNSSGIAALRGAIADRAEQGRLFGKGSPVAAILEFEDPVKGFAKILNSKRPVQAVRTLRAATRNQPEAWEGVQELMARKVLKYELAGTTRRVGRTGGISGTIKNIEGKRLVFDEVYGKGSAQRAIRLLHRLEKQQTGRVGTPGFSRMVGSNQMTEQQSRGLLKAAWNSLGDVGKSIVKYAQVEPTDQNVLRLWNDIFQDKELAGVFLRSASEDEIRQQAIRWSRNVGRTAHTVPVDQE